MIPIRCKICSNCNREEEYCEIEPKAEFINTCESFEFEPLYLIDVLEELSKK